MKKKEYESPQMEILEVKPEHGFMSASVIDKKEDAEVTSISQEVEGSYTFDGTSTWE